MKPEVSIAPARRHLTTIALRSCRSMIVVGVIAIGVVALRNGTLSSGGVRLTLIQIAPLLAGVGSATFIWDFWFERTGAQRRKISDGN